jgi:multidrug resistance efflux pump
MENTPENSVTEEHTIEIQEILGKIPGWIFSYGLLILFLTVSMAAISCYFIIIPAKHVTTINLTTTNAPAPLITKATGRIHQVFVANGEAVGANKVLALLESSADYADILSLDAYSRKFEGDWENYVKIIDMPRNLQLGDVQNTYLSFYTTFNNFKRYLQFAEVEKKSSLQLKRISQIQGQLANLAQQKEIRLQSLKITKNHFDGDSVFFIQNAFGVPRRELDLTKQGYLKEKEGLISIDIAIRNTQETLLQSEELLIESAYNHRLKVSEFSNQLIEKYLQLVSEIKLWKETYLISAPIAGKVTFTNYWSSNQYITSGERFATLIPSENNQIVARAKIGSAVVSRIKKGTKAKIFLSGYPATKYGYLEGKVINISLIPEEHNYFVEIALVQGMLTKMDFSIPFIHEMEGTAELELSSERLLFKLLKNVAPGSGNQ